MYLVMIGKISELHRSHRKWLYQMSQLNSLDLIGLIPIHIRSSETGDRALYLSWIKVYDWLFLRIAVFIEYIVPESWDKLWRYRQNWVRSPWNACDQYKPLGTRDYIKMLSTCGPENTDSIPDLAPNTGLSYLDLTAITNIATIVCFAMSESEHHGLDM